MKHRILLLFFWAAFLLPVLLPAEIATGEKAPELPSPIWMDGKQHMWSDQKGKKYTVLFLWNADQMGLAELPAMVSAYSRCDRNETAFYGIGTGTPDMLRQVPGVTKLPFPVNADHKGAAAALFQRQFDRLPMAVVINKEGVVAWRGRTSLVPSVIRQMLEGKYDLPEKIRTEKFSRAVTDAVREKKFAEANALVRKEWEVHPENMELLSLQLTLLQGKLQKTDEAFALIAEAQKRLPGNDAVYELEYRLIRNSKKADKLPEYTDRLLKTFAEKPMVLLHFAGLELSASPEEIRPDAIWSMMHTGWKKGKFKDGDEKGHFAIEYAKVLHSFGHGELAVKLAQEAEKSFTGERSRKGAASAVIYYRKLLEISKSIREE